MLSSIHPLGERARGNRWGITITAFVLGAVAAGAAVGSAAGLVGSSLSTTNPTRAALLAMVALVFAALDVMGVPAPGPKRQVNERWIGQFRGWVYGLGFGAQLGAGTLTFVVTWGVWATYLAMAISGSPRNGALVGAVFGLGRSLLPLAAVWIDRPSRLSAFSIRMASLGPPVRTATSLLLVAVAATAVLG